MSAEAAHTGKPVYADTTTIREFWLQSYVRPLGENGMLDDEPLPSLDIAGGIASAILQMHEHYLHRQEHKGGAGEPWVNKLGGKVHALSR
jgi:hypothetical protein